MSSSLLNRLSHTPSTSDFPPELDFGVYRDRNADLATFSNAQLSKHYCVHGRREGRTASLAMFREKFLNIIDTELPTLEIGPFLRPAVQGANVAYFDVLDQPALERRAKALGKDGVPPFIHYVSPTGDLSIVDRKFDNVVSSHCIEHQPDLVRHLKDVGDLLAPGGHYFLVVPDKRFCFDHFIAPSTIADVLDAHEEGRMLHTLTSVIEHRALTTHNDAGRHWRGDHADPDYHDRIVPRCEAALHQFRNSAGTYIDVHAWQFTPDSFRAIMVALQGLGPSQLKPIRVYNTPYNRFEFTAILKKDADIQSPTHFHEGAAE